MRKDHGPDSGNWRGCRVCSLSPGDFMKNTAIQYIKQCRKENRNKENKKTGYIEKTVQQFTCQIVKKDCNSIYQFKI